MTYKQITWSSIAIFILFLVLFTRIIIGMIVIAAVVCAIGLIIRAIKCYGTCGYKRGKSWWK